MLPAGEAICLFTAALWASSVTLFHRPIAEHGARTVNLAKCTLGTVLQGITVLALGQAGVVAGAAPRDVAFLAVSGVVGLSLGDTALFAAVGSIGVHRTLLLQTLAPVFTAAIAAGWRGEIPTAQQALGAAIVLAGIALVVAPRGSRTNGAARIAGWGAWGVAAGVVAAACQGAGVVLAKAGLDTLPAVSASFVRLAAAAVALLAIGFATGYVRRLPALVRSPLALRRVVPATFLGTYLALFLMMAGVALAPAAIAAVLLGTSPIFALVLECALERRLPSAAGLSGTLLAVAGVAVLVAG